MCLSLSVDKDLQPKEVFVGLNAPPDTCGKTIATVIEDALLRLQRPIKKLRAQAFDVASNMSDAIMLPQLLKIITVSYF